MQQIPQTILKNATQLPPFLASVGTDDTFLSTHSSVSAGYVLKGRKDSVPPICPANQHLAAAVLLLAIPVRCMEQETQNSKGFREWESWIATTSTKKSKSHPSKKIQTFYNWFSPQNKIQTVLKNLKTSFWLPFHKTSGILVMFGILPHVQLILSISCFLWNRCSELLESEILFHGTLLHLFIPQILEMLDSFCSTAPAFEKAFPISIKY